MTPVVTLRRAEAADAMALADLGTRSFVAKFGHMYVPNDLSDFLAKAHSEPAVAVEIANPDMRVHLAERDGALVGFCKLMMRCGWPEHARGDRTIELKQLYTDPAMIGLGIGGMLTRWAIDEAHAFGADEIQLSVWSGNQDAQRFYVRHGFAKVADTEFWVGRQRDEEFLFAALF